MLRKLPFEKEKEIAKFYMQYYIGEHHIDKPTLLPGKEAELLIAAKKGDKEAREKLLANYTWLIKQMAAVYWDYTYPENEYTFQEIMYGATEAFDNSVQQYKFSSDYSFAVYLMNGIALNFNINTNLANPASKEYALEDNDSKKSK